jgi:hypothetical protein
VEGLSAQYTREMRRHFNYSATWLPTANVCVGDVGILTGGEYQRVGFLADFGIEYTTIAAPTIAALSYASANAVNMTVKLAGAVPIPGSALSPADAGIQLTFGAENAVFFQAADCASTSISNLVALESQIIARNGEQAWPADYVVIIEVLHAQCATIVISSSDNAMVELKARATVEISSATLADTNAGLQIAQSRNIGTQIIARGGLVPLFKAYGLRRRLFGRPKLAARGTAESGDMKERPVQAEVMTLKQVDYSDF